MCQSCLTDPGAWTNEQTVCHYRDLAFTVVNQFAKSYRLSPQDIEDLEQELMRKLIISPASYRPKSSGMYTLLKNGAIDFMRKRLRRECEVTNFQSEGDELKQRGNMLNVLKDETNYEREFSRGLDASKLIEQMNSLPEPERICLTLFFGIGRPSPLSRYLIARKLRASEEWVERRLTRGKFIMRRHIERRSLPVTTGRANA